jgi:hypothetical protein
MYEVAKISEIKNSPKSGIEFCTVLLINKATKAKLVHTYWKEELDMLELVVGDVVEL